MPDLPRPSRRATQEAAFAAAFPELEGMSTAEIRLIQARARQTVVAERKRLAREQALREWYSENQLPLPVELH